jgi:hypothetical protein
VAKLLHEQKAEAFLLALNVNKAIVMLIKEIFNESIWADLNKGTTIGSSSLRNRHSVQQIRDHLEFKFNKHRSVDIQTVIDKFGMEVDTAQPLEKYFERQQQCQQLLTETSEPIRDANMKQTAIGHFLKIPHLICWVCKYESIDPTGASTWEELRTYYIDKQMEHINDQAKLAMAGIANSAEVDEELNGMKYEMANMVEKTQQLEEALVAMAAFMAEAKQPPPAPAPTPPPATLSMEQQFATFVAAQQQKEAPKEQSAINKAVAKALGELSTKGSSGGGSTSGTSGSKKKRKPSKCCVFYCPTHGCNFSHNSSKCEGKKTDHIDAATFSSPSNGKMWNKDIYTRPGCLPCNAE